MAKLTPHAVFNYILQFLYRGCQGKQLPIEKDAQAKPEIHYTRIYRAFRRWQANTRHLAPPSGHYDDRTGC